MTRKMICGLLTVVLALVLVPTSNAQDGSTLQGWIFEDLNNNGVRDPGEPGVAPSVVCLVGYDWCDHTEWGEFMFDMLDPGKYKLKLVDFADGYHPRTRRMVVLEVGEDEIAEVNFALVPIPGRGR